jgi:hypothetical protein
MSQLPRVAGPDNARCVCGGVLQLREPTLAVLGHEKFAVEVEIKR